MNISSQIASFPNVEFGITALVTKISKGYCVTLFDDDAQLVAGDCTIYPFNMLNQAVTYAKKLANL